MYAWIEIVRTSWSAVASDDCGSALRWAGVAAAISGNRVSTAALDTTKKTKTPGSRDLLIHFCLVIRCLQSKGSAAASPDHPSQKRSTTLTGENLSGSDLWHCPPKPKWMR